MSPDRPSEERTQFEEGSGNVFADIGIPDPEEAQAKAQLADILAESLREKGLSQAQSAEFLGIDQGSVSRLVNGRLDGFSQERLIRYLNALGNNVEIVVRPPDGFRDKGRLIVASG